MLSLRSLDALISELDKIEEQQATLRTAAQQKFTVVVHPRDEVRTGAPDYQALMHVQRKRGIPQHCARRLRLACILPVAAGG